MKNVFKTLFLKLGIKVNRIPSKNEVKKLRKQELINRNLWLINLKIKTVLDIGANTGQFAEKILDILPDIYLYCFEPIKACYLELEQNIGSNNKVKFFNFALGNENGSQTIHLNESSTSSSLLEMNKLHKEAFPFTEKSKKENIFIKKLDDIKEGLVLEKPLFIKIDVQGFEMEVIRGGLEIIKQADIIFIETSFEELYSGQPLFHEIYSLLYEYGFIFQGNFEQLIRPNDGKILQADSIFVKKK